MNILVTGSKGMVGTALVNNLKNIKDNKNRTRPDISIDDIFEYDIDSTPEETLNNMSAAVDKFVRHAEQFDDLTMLALEYKGAQSE